MDGKYISENETGNTVSRPVKKVELKLQNFLITDQICSLYLMFHFILNLSCCVGTPCNYCLSFQLKACLISAVKMAFAVVMFL